MLANLAELVASVRVLINETTEGFWLTTEIEDFLNEGHDTFTAETKCLSKFYSHTLIADDIKHDREIRFYSDFVALDEGGVLYNDKPLIPTSLKALDEHGGTTWRDKTGTPTHFYKRGDMLGFYPKPSAGGVVKYYGIERATTLSGEVVPFSGDYRTIPFRRHIRNYAISLCWEKKGEDRKADKWMAKFNKGLYNAAAILVGDKTQNMKIIPAYTPKRRPYSTNYGSTYSSID